MTLVVSAAPATASRLRVSQRVRVRPNPAMAMPQMAAVISIVRACREQAEGLRRTAEMGGVQCREQGNGQAEHHGVHAGEEHCSENQVTPDVAQAVQQIQERLRGEDAGHRGNAAAGDQHGAAAVDRGRERSAEQAKNQDRSAWASPIAPTANEECVRS